MMYAAAIAVLYFLLVVFTEGAALVWTWYALYYIWSLAPLPFSILMIGFPTLFILGIVFARRDISMPRFPVPDDRHRQNPPEPKKKVRREPDPPTPLPEVEPTDLDKVVEDYKKQKSRPYTEPKKPPQPKIWGIDP